MFDIPRRRSITIFYIAVFPLLFIIVFAGWYGNNKQQPQKPLPLPSPVAKQVLAAKDQKTRQEIPVRLQIPKINVDANIQNVGLTSAGAMEVPTNATDAGWFGLGPRPGERGSAVIAGHFDGMQGEGGIFVNLYKLQAGDTLYIVDTKGTSIPFVVRKTHIYDPGYADEVFSRSDSSHLNLITCDGVWDGATKSYSKRLVVFADKMR